MVAATLAIILRLSGKEPFPQIIALESIFLDNWSPFSWTFGVSAGLLMGSQEALSLDSFLILQLYPSPDTL